MHADKAPRMAKRDIRINCGRYFVRTIRRDDVSDRWARWLSDPWAMRALNLPARTMEKKDILDYLKNFDQRSNFLLGIFEKRTLAHVGIIRLDVEPRFRQGIVNLLIGEPEHRNRGLMLDVAVSTLDHLFEAGLTKLSASTLSRNALIIGHLEKTGWRREPSRSETVKSSADGGTLELCTFSLSREAWQAWSKTTFARRVRERVRRFESELAQKGR